MTKVVYAILLVLGAMTFTSGKIGTYIPKGGRRPVQTLSRGWGDQLQWAQTYEQALHLCQTSKKPLMVLFHLEDCKHSAALKKAFAADVELQKMLDEDFIILNLTFETTDKNMSPDGTYVPRILFVDPSLTVRSDIISRYGNRLYAYEPADLSLLKENLKKAKKLLKTEL
ncbi:anterior gradient protein 2 homolog [Thalassophryne amazonica]|uniref:anterior gradient protein 2 homolog n=1 Tax=Thalassophryne amazonica TaxID=390379 RepID=UPI001471A645|nr:anterior gradient protein 2 homolog [Thalassophryne amazonica]